MIANLPVSALNSPVGKALLNRVFPDLRESDLALIGSLIDNYAKDGSVKVGDLLNDPIVASMINGRDTKSPIALGVSIHDYADAHVQCPYCKSVGELKKFAPKLFQGGKNG